MISKQEEKTEYEEGIRDIRGRFLDHFENLYIENLNRAHADRDCVGFLEEVPENIRHSDVHCQYNTKEKIKATNSQEMKQLQQISKLIVKMQMFQVDQEQSGMTMKKITDSIHKFPHLYIKMPTSNNCDDDYKKQGTLFGEHSFHYKSSSELPGSADQTAWYDSETCTSESDTESTEFNQAIYREQLLV